MKGMAPALASRKVTKSDSFETPSLPGMTTSAERLYGVAVYALWLLQSGLLAAASSLPSSPVGGPSLCPTPDGLWQELASLLTQEDLRTRLQPVRSGEPPVRIDDLGPSFRVSLLGQEREYRDEARDCARRARIGALFAALVIHRDGNPGRVPKPSREAARPAEPAGSARDREGNPGRVPEPSRDAPLLAKPAGSARVCCTLGTCGARAQPSSWRS